MFVSNEIYKEKKKKIFYVLSVQVGTVTGTYVKTFPLKYL